MVGVDVDADALEIAEDNLDELGADNTELVRANVVDGLPWRSSADGLFDTVVMNPPFGTKTQRGVDMAFLRAGFEVRDPGGASAGGEGGALAQGAGPGERPWYGRGTALGRKELRDERPLSPPHPPARPKPQAAVLFPCFGF